MCWVSRNGSAAKMHTTSQLLTVSRYMSRGRRWMCSGRPGSTSARPATKVIMLDQRNDGRSRVRSKTISVIMGTTMKIARVIRKMPMMKPMIRRVGNAMKSAQAEREGRHSTCDKRHVNQQPAGPGRLAAEFALTDSPHSN